MKTILLIEDNQLGRENTAEILALAGYHVVPAADGRQGVEAARRQPRIDRADPERQHRPTAQPVPLDRAQGFT